MGILTMEPFQLILYIAAIMGFIFVVAIVWAYMRSWSKKRQNNKSIAGIITYMDSGFKKGYGAEDLVSQLIFNGWTLLDCNRALKALGRKPV